MRYSCADTVSYSRQYHLTKPTAPTYLEARNLLLYIVGQVTEASPVSRVQCAKFPLESLLIQNLTNAYTPPCSLIAVAGTNPFPSGSNLATTQTGLFQAVNDRVQIKADVRAVRDKDALPRSAETLCFKLG